MSTSSVWDSIFDGPPIRDPSPQTGPGLRKPRAAKAEAAKPGKRLDIQGLRAVAVLAVILNHLTPWLRGGFVGVDIFFVISGFLITGHLVSDTAKRGHVSFRGFYTARARRILPAAVVTLAASWIAAGLIFKGARVSSIHNDIVWALGFGANIHFSRVGTDYFEANRPVSPVQHYWSLSVEEQFYVVWPLVIALVMLAFGRRARTARFKSVLLAVAGLALVASFAWGMHESSAAPTSAYFSTVVRAWELGIGAVLAVAVSRYPNFAARLGRARGPIARAGLVLVIVSLFVVKSAPGFPAPWAALPVLATAVVIFAGSAGDTTRSVRVLTNPVAVYVGDISYSLYLWHFPAIIYIAALVPHSSAVKYTMTVCAIAASSIFSYHYIEQPFRKRREADSSGSRDTNRAYPLLAAAVLTVTVFAAYLQLPEPEQAPVLTAAAPSSGAAAPKINPDVAVPSSTFANTLRASVEASRWPDLNPSVDKLDLTTARAGWGSCFDLGETESLRDCRFSNSPTDHPGKVAMVLGDSVAVSWLPAVRAALVPAGWTVYGITHGLCPAALVRVDAKPKDPNTSGDCDGHHDWMVSRTLGLKPSLVIMSQALNTLDRLRSNATGSAAFTEYQHGVESAEQTFSKGGAKVVTLTPPPEGAGLSSCDTVASAPRDCITTIDDGWKAMANAEHLAAAATKSISINTSAWFCYQSYCPSFFGSTAVFYDKEHITAEFAKLLGPEMAAALKTRNIL